jgi:DNA mismatch endonuclease (patch repair protein)
MTDTVTPGERSRMMSAVRGTDTKPELFVRRALHAKGFRFRLHRADLPGRPDLVLPRFRTVVFIHGCFWHGHHCRRGKLPDTRKEFWERKIRGNVERDCRAQSALTELGWSVITIWTCELEDKTDQLISTLRQVTTKVAR